MPVDIPWRPKKKPPKNPPQNKEQKSQQYLAVQVKINKFYMYMHSVSLVLH